jgi:hypothetical protein
MVGSAVVLFGRGAEVEDLLDSHLYRCQLLLIMPAQLLAEGQGKIETVQTCTSQPFSRNNRASRSRAEVVVEAVMAESWSSASCCEAVKSILVRRCLAALRSLRLSVAAASY